MIKVLSTTRMVRADASAPQVASEQSLDFERILPFASKVFDISTRVEDYYLTSVPILTSDLPNRNGIGMPLSELLAWNPEIGRQAYKGWKGMPLHYEHKSDVHKEAIGIIADVALLPVKGYNGGRIYKVMALAAVDTTKRVNITSRIARGELTTWSMGCMVEDYSCSYCGKPEGRCLHIDPNKNVEFYELNGVLVYRNVHKLKPFELSAVNDHAFPCAIGIHENSIRYAAQ